MVKAPDSKLRKQTKPVKKITLELVKILKEMVNLTRTFKDPEGVGLASTQIGLDGRFFVAKMFYGSGKQQKEMLKAFINPQILSLSKNTKTYFEGCLSIPHYWGDTIRALSAKVSYTDIEGKTVTETLKGFNAWVFQHEVDHLNGMLFVDRVLQQKGKFYKFTGKDKTGTDLFEEVTL